MDTVEWLLDSDVAIRWQVMRDLTEAPEDDVTAERARVATEGWGARLLAIQRQDGHWDKSTPARLTYGGGVKAGERMPLAHSLGRRSLSTPVAELLRFRYAWESHRSC